MFLLRNLFVLMWIREMKTKFKPAREWKETK